MGDRLAAISAPRDPNAGRPRGRPDRRLGRTWLPSALRLPRRARIAAIRFRIERLVAPPVTAARDAPTAAMGELPERCWGTP